MNVDDKILDGCQAGHNKAQYDLFKLCYPHLMRICDRYHQNEIDARSDLNESFLKILTKLESFDRSRSFYSWCRQIVVRTIIDNFRKKKAKYKINFEEQEMIDASHMNQTMVMNEADLKCDAEELLGIIKNLPDSSRRIFNMHTLEGFSHAEIAKELKISEGTSKWHVHSARKILKKQIDILEKQKRMIYV